eukprot:64979_1
MLLFYTCVCTLILAHVISNTHNVVDMNTNINCKHNGMGSNFNAEAINCQYLQHTFTFEHSQSIFNTYGELCQMDYLATSKTKHIIAPSEQSYIELILCTIFVLLSFIRWPWNQQFLFIIILSTTLYCTFAVVNGIQYDLIEDLPESSFTTTSTHSLERCSPKYSKQSYGKYYGWCAASKTLSNNVYLQIEFISIQRVTSVTIYPNFNSYTTYYHLLYSIDGITFSNAKNIDNNTLFKGNNVLGNFGADSILFEPILTKYIRVIPTAFSNWPIIRIQAFGEFPDIKFDELSVENFSGNNGNPNTFEIGWFKFAQCTEGKGSSLHGIKYANEYSVGELISILKYAVTIKLLPSSDIPGQIENNNFALTADICSDPIWAINNGYEMSFILDKTTASVIGYSNINNWFGTSTAKNRLNNSCLHLNSPKEIIDSFIYDSCGNSNGLQIMNGNQCEWNKGEIVGENITIWIGFDVNKNRKCEFRDDGIYKLSSVTSCNDIYGGEWMLVRHSYNSWYQATDNLVGTAVYGYPDPNPKSKSSWSMQYNIYLETDGSTLFLFSNGECSEWIVTINNEFLTAKGEDYSAYIIASHYDINYNTTWNYDTNHLEDPMISWNNNNNNYLQSILYAENNYINKLD